MKNTPLQVRLLHSKWSKSTEILYVICIFSNNEKHLFCRKSWYILTFLIRNIMLFRKGCGSLIVYQWSKLSPYQRGGVVSKGKMSWKVRWFQNIYWASCIRNKHYLHLFLFTISYKRLQCAASTVLVTWGSIELFVSQNISLSRSCESQCITKKHWTSPLCITMLLWKDGMKSNCWGRGKEQKGFLLPEGSRSL